MTRGAIPRLPWNTFPLAAVPSAEQQWPWVPAITLLLMVTLPVSMSAIPRLFPWKRALLRTLLEVWPVEPDSVMAAWPPAYMHTFHGSELGGHTESLPVTLLTESIIQDLIVNILYAKRHHWHQT